MKGKPDAKSSQQQDYVKITSNGKVLDWDGLVIDQNRHPSPLLAEEAHIPLNDWLKWREWNNK